MRSRKCSFGTIKSFGHLKLKPRQFLANCEVWSHLRWPRLLLSSRPLLLSGTPPLTPRRCIGAPCDSAFTVYLPTVSYKSSPCKAKILFIFFFSISPSQENYYFFNASVLTSYLRSEFDKDSSDEVLCGITGRTQF